MVARVALLAKDRFRGNEVRNRESVTIMNRSSCVMHPLPRPFVHGRGDPLWSPGDGLLRRALPFGLQCAVIMAGVFQQ